MKQIFLIAISCFILSGCSFSKSKVNNAGVSNITGLNVSGNIALDIKRADRSRLEILTSDDVRAELQVTTEGSTLHIKDRYKLHHEAVTIILEVPELQELSASGSIKGAIEGIKTRNFTLNVSGATSLTLSGVTQNFEISASGAIHIDASRLASDCLDIQGAGSGSVSYHGDPVIKKSLVGAISLCKKI